MRDLNECKAEVFRRSENRIKVRRRRRKKALSLCMPLCLCAILFVTTLPARQDRNTNAEQSTVHSTAGSNVGIHTDECTLENFSFSLTWGAYGISSYDSETGVLVKANQDTAVKPASKPSNALAYTTNYQLSPAQEEKIFQLIKELDINAYPNVYNPHQEGLTSSPSMTLILTVRAGGKEKTVTAANIAMTFASQDAKGQEFLSVCKAIRDVLMETEEWKALPEYPYLYS